MHRILQVQLIGVPSRALIDFAFVMTASVVTRKTAIRRKFVAVGPAVGIQLIPRISCASRVVATVKRSRHPRHRSAAVIDDLLRLRIHSRLTLPARQSDPVL
jgi:hypothetical protein